MPKVIYFCINDIIHGVRGGGPLFSARNIDMLRAFYGEKNVIVFDFVDPLPTEPLPEHITALPRSERLTDALFSALRGYKVMYPRDAKKILQKIKEISPAAVFFDSSVLGKLIRAVRAMSIHTVVFSQNVEHDYAWEKVRHQGLPYLFSFWASCYNERLAMQNADLVIALNTRDQKRLASLYGRSADLVLPITLIDRFVLSRTAECRQAKELLFCGALFPPNLDAVRWFIQNVLPLLPGFALTVVGNGFEAYRSELGAPNVRVIGRVDNVDNYFYEYPAVVMPIRYGAGMKVKTAEAMMFGRTIFATDEALEGYEVNGVDGIYRCNSAQEFANAISACFAQPVPNVRPAVRDAFLNGYEFGRMQREFFSLLRERLDAQSLEDGAAL